MALYNRILLPVDGSGRTMAAVSQAVHLGRLGGEIIVLTVLPRIPNVIGGEARKIAQHAATEDAEHITKPVMDLITEANIACRTEVVFSTSPARGIIQAAEDTNSDLIIIGSNGHNDLEGLLLGSVTHSILAAVSIPVLVVR